MSARWLDIPFSLAEGDEKIERLIRVINEGMRGLGGTGTGGATTNNYSSSTTVVQAGGGGPWFTVAYAATVTLAKADGRNQRLALTGDCVLEDPVGFANGDELLLRLQADATGGRTVTFRDPAKWELPAGWTIYLAANRQLVLHWVFDATGKALLASAPIEL